MASNRLADVDAWNFFLDLFGGNEYAAAGACGNMMWESGLYTDNAENSWNNKTGHSDEWLTERINNNLTGTTPVVTLSEFLQRSWYVNSIGFGYGLSQWTSESRRTTLWNRTIGQGIPIDNQQAQLDYIKWEFNNGWASVKTRLMATTSVYDATKIYCDSYEGGAWSQKRLDYAQDFYDRFAGTATGYPIVITVNGNGQAWASYGEVEIHRAEEGQRIELSAVPNGDDYFLLWTVDYPSTLQLENPVTDTQNYFTMPASKVNITATFTGETPTPPTPPEPPPYIGRYKKHKMPIWMYPMFRC